MDKIKEIPPMPKSVSEHRQQQHNLLYQIKYAVDDMKVSNKESHQKICERLDRSEAQDRVQNYKIIGLISAVFMLAGATAYLHSGLSLTGVVGLFGGVTAILMKVLRV